MVFFIAMLKINTVQNLLWIILKIYKNIINQSLNKNLQINQIVYNTTLLKKIS